jgi:hypothetical protein
MAGSIALLSLLSVISADAAPRRASGPVCDPQTPVARKLPRHPRSFGGPLKQPSSHVLAGLQDITVRMVRGNRAYLAVGVVAIQNDSPINGTGGDDHLIPSLRPLERVPFIDLQPHSRAFSPRSPRGPPALA